ncbi:hypothetical protein HU200_000698 [Digitaria exilis]|uniref:Disease resistance protein At4g27190-like leucine-rich repeats domain-containing protein n=1 Tax=Digitaria exilis TaxID=1010633 RepID=A0A835KX07_9POAL|nr:hypothetical protein HU200_000698 [Digitaria exilis]
MQRKIAEELKLEDDAMALFEKQDEEDDFTGVDHCSRDVIKHVAKIISQTLRDRSFMMIFLNGSDDEVDLSRFGVILTEFDSNMMIWTFNRFLTIHRPNCANPIVSKLRYTKRFLAWEWYPDHTRHLKSSQFVAVMRELTATIVARNACMQSIDPKVVTDCCLHELFQHYSFHKSIISDWVAAHASNYWICNGILNGGMTKEMINVLYQEIRWECDGSLLDEIFEVLMKQKEFPFLVVKDNVIHEKWSPYRWISISSKKLMLQYDVLQISLLDVSSLFVALEKSNSPQGLPNKLFEHGSNLAVLTLSYCAFNFVEPPFLHQCPRLRFLGLDRCTHENTSEGGNSEEWKCLHNLWVLDIRYTEWNEILCGRKLDLMANLTELNIEGVRCWQYISQLQGKLPDLQKLRIINPSHQGKTSAGYCSNSFADKTKLEILDLSGNKDMNSLPASLSTASSLEVLVLDGCAGLENVVLPNKLASSLRSFSFDGYGPALRWISIVGLPPESSRPKPASDANKMEETIKTSKISLEGCKKLEKLFLRGLPNLEELNLSGTAVKLLDFGTMVVDCPSLKRVFLLGCEQLRAIRWGSYDEQLNIELLCIDTRPGRAPRFGKPLLSQHKDRCSQLHAIFADARLARSLESYLYHTKDVYYNIHITSSTEYVGILPLEATIEGTIEPSNQLTHNVVASQYGDVPVAKIGGTMFAAVLQPPTQRLDRHIEISEGAISIESELSGEDGSGNLGSMINHHAKSLHLHDASLKSSLPSSGWNILRWCRVERCPNMETVFPPWSSCFFQLETVWASDLPMARCIRSNGGCSQSYENLQHLHLYSCPRLQFALPVKDAGSCPSLKTIHVNHCSSLRHIFVLDGSENPKIRAAHGMLSPKLNTIHLYDLPSLRQISEFKMLAPALETIRVRGCFGLRRLPSLAGRKPGTKKPIVEMEKDVWDALEWDGPDHHPSLFEPPVHSRYYRKKRLLRGTVLRYVPTFVLSAQCDDIYNVICVIVLVLTVCNSLRFSHCLGESYPVYNCRPSASINMMDYRCFVPFMLVFC